VGLLQRTCRNQVSGTQNDGSFRPNPGFVSHPSEAARQKASATESMNLSQELEAFEAVSAVEIEWIASAKKTT